MQRVRPDTTPEIQRTEPLLCDSREVQFCRPRLEQCFLFDPTNVEAACDCFTKDLIDCIRAAGCENVPEDLYEYCFNELHCSLDQCLLNGATSAMLSVAVVALAVVAAVMQAAAVL